MTADRASATAQGRKLARLERDAATAAHKAALWDGRLAAAREVGLHEEVAVMFRYFRTLATQAAPRAPRETAAVVIRCYKSLRPVLEDAITSLQKITEQGRGTRPRQRRS